MNKIAQLIEKSIDALENNKQTIYRQIEILVSDCTQVDRANYFLFHIDDRSWYCTYFHAFNKREPLTETELELPEFLAEAVDRAYEIGDDEDGDSADTLFEKVNDLLIDIIAESWLQAGGKNLTQPAYINFHDSYFYYDIKQEKYFGEDDLDIFAL